MGKVICERARVHQPVANDKTGKKLNVNLDWDSDEYDWGPSRISSGRTKQGRFGGSYKALNDYLSPLRRLLKKSVGRPWDETYSEICEFADPRSLSGYHLRQHVHLEVGVYGRYGVDRETGLLYKQERWKGWKYNQSVESLTHNGVDYKLVHFYKTACCKFDRCLENKYWFRDVPKCMHGREGKLIRSLWFSYEYKYHQPDEVFRCIRFETATSIQRAKYNLLAPGDVYRKLYKDVPEEMNEPYEMVRRQASRREVALIRDLRSKTV